MEKEICNCNSRVNSIFNEWEDYYKHQEKVNDNIYFKNMPVLVPYTDTGFIEKWYQCNKCGVKWRLVEPDLPFRGNWSKVSG